LQGNASVKLGRLLLILLLLISSMTGCLPFALPPLRAELGGSPSSGPSGSESDVAGPVVSGRLGFHPLQVFRDTTSRAWDVGVGYARESSSGRTAHHGPYAELAAYPLRGDASSGKRFRVGLMTIAQAYLDPTSPYRTSATVAGTAEIAGFSDGTFQSDDASGVARGEWGLGIFAGPSARFGGADVAWSGTVGITARVPMALGFVCCLQPSWLKGSSGRSKAKAPRRHLRRPHPERRSRGEHGTRHERRSRRDHRRSTRPSGH
jgi:hypothetical protein